MTPGQRKRLRARRVRKRINLGCKRRREADMNPKEYVGCGFCSTILIHNADLSYQILGIAHDAGHPRICSICMNKMDKPVEKWLAQKWMNSYEMAMIWNAVRQGRKINQDIRDAILGLMERTIDKFKELHDRRQAEPEFIDGIWYRNAGQVYAYSGKLIALIAMWENSEHNPDMRAWLKKTPFIVTRPRPPGMTIKQMKAMNYGRKPKQETAAVQRARRNDLKNLGSDGCWVGKRRRPREVSRG